MRVIITPVAQRELEAIGDYIARDNLPRAMSFTGELVAKCLDLANFPERFPLMDRYRKSGVRRRIHGKYLIFYRIDADAVQVIHILQGATDYSFLLDED